MCQAATRSECDGERGAVGAAAGADSVVKDDQEGVARAGGGARERSMRVPRSDAARSAGYQRVFRRLREASS
jgi:hypothetical protein